MTPTTITLRSDYKYAPPFEAQGFVPFDGSPLAVTHAASCDMTKKPPTWSERRKWRITHVATGHRLGDAEWATAEEAMAVLLRCDPAFAAWRMVQAGVPDAALVACQVKFRSAMA